jgi:hypothetical protein
MKSNILIILSAIVFITGCNKKNKNKDWLSSDNDSAFVQIEKHFRGFDMAMQEVGYRYNELYWAGIDENWGYAQYHLEKIKTAIDNGLERRPKRAASAQGFLEYSIPALMKTIQDKNKASFMKEFEIFRQSCNSCHLQEKVEFMKVSIPDVRLSPINPANEKRNKE